MYTFPLDSLNRKMIGFERLFDEIARNDKNKDVGNYPPTNIISLEKDKFIIELAVAGFSQNELNIEQKDRMLKISGFSATKETLEDAKYIHRGIANRPFVREFTLGEYVVVEDAEFENGILHIRLKRELPEEMQPKIIPINGTPRGDPQLLMEEKEA